MISQTALHQPTSPAKFASKATPIFAPLQQSKQYLRALTAMGQRPELIKCGDVGKAVMIKRGPIKYTARGPVWAPNSHAKDRCTALQNTKLHAIDADAPTAALLNRLCWIQVLTPATQAILPLARDPVVQLDNAHQKWRNACRKGKKSGLQVAQATFDTREHHWLLVRDLAQQKAKGFRALPQQFTHAYCMANPDDTLIWTASKSGVPIAAMLFLRHGTSATYHIGWANPLGRSTCAHHVLLQCAATYFAQHDVAWLDLGQIDTINAPGLARFKLGCGAQPIALGGTWLRPPRVRMWRRKPCE